MSDEPGPATKSDRTRRRILDAARAHFGEHGYRSATIRGIAADASIDPSMVVRYFGSKRDLFASAVDLDLRIPDLGGRPRAGLGRGLVEHFLARWEGGDDTLVTLLRSAASEPDAVALLRRLFAEQLTPAVAQVVGDDGTAPLRASLVASQMLGLAVTRDVLGLEPLAGASRTEVARLVGPTVQRYLTGPVGRGGQVGRGVRG
jgi:AcrR family transcriptional regulator